MHLPFLYLTLFLVTQLFFETHRKVIFKLEGSHFQLLKQVLVIRKELMLSEEMAGTEQQEASRFKKLLSDNTGIFSFWAYVLNTVSFHSIHISLIERISIFKSI